ncbi:MAG: hypothetical protein V1855_03610 [bacterium]
MRKTKSVFIISVLLLIIPKIAMADAGVPMLLLTFPAMLIALIPIIVIEAVIISKFLKVGFKKAVGPSSVANILTTIIGFPLSWALLFGLEYLATGGSCGPGFSTIGKSIITVIVESAWICPREQAFWLIPVAAIICLVVAFFISVFYEYVVLKRYFKQCDKQQIKKTVWITNTVTYALLVVACLIYLFVTIQGQVIKLSVLKQTEVQDRPLLIGWNDKNQEIKTLKVYQPGEIITAFRATAESSYLYYSVKLEDGQVGYVIYLGDNIKKVRDK